MNAIQVETDPQNTHMLLGGLMLCVQDSALFEECADINVDTRQTSPAPSDTNLLSSGMLRFRCYMQLSNNRDKNTMGNRIYTTPLRFSCLILVRKEIDHRVH